MTIPGVTSTGSKRPAALFGVEEDPVGPMVRAEGCRLWTERGREYVDYIMALGAVSLGYAHPGVVAAATQALRDGGVGSLAPSRERDLADRLGAREGLERVRFLKTGAEAVSAAVRIARVATGRERIVTVGYQGWLDPFSSAAGVPEAVRGLRTEVAFNDIEGLHEAVTDDVAAVVVEPVVDAAPTREWTEALTTLRDATGALVVLDEIKTGLRLGVRGARNRYGYLGDLVVLGKALANGFPLAAVGGRAAVMDACERTWISSTLATEFVSLAAADAVLDAYEDGAVERHLLTAGGQLFIGLQEVAASAAHLVTGVRGIPEFCYLQFADPDVGARFARRCADVGLLFKRNAYNFVSYAHSDEVVRETLVCLKDIVEEIAWG